MKECTDYKKCSECINDINCGWCNTNNNCINKNNNLEYCKKEELINLWNKNLNCSDNNKNDTNPFDLNINEKSIIENNLKNLIDEEFNKTQLLNNLTELLNETKFLIENSEKYNNFNIAFNGSNLLESSFLFLF